jgi:hypothetical protein
MKGDEFESGADRLKSGGYAQEQRPIKKQILLLKELDSANPYFYCRYL